MNDYQKLSQMGAAAQRANTAARIAKYRLLFEQMVDAGMTYGNMKAHLDALEVRTPSGSGSWSRSMCFRLVKQLDLEFPSQAACG